MSMVKLILSTSATSTYPRKPEWNGYRKSPSWDAVTLRAKYSGMRENPENRKPDLSIVRANWAADQIVQFEGQAHDWYMYAPLPHGYWAFPIHNTCISMMKTVGERRLHYLCDGSTKAIKPTTLEQFYDSLCERIKHNHKHAKSSSFGVNWEHGQYGAGWISQIEGGWISVPGTQWLCIDPMSVPDLTSYIISRLEALPSQGKELPNVLSGTTKETGGPVQAVSRTSALCSLPVEIINHITSRLTYTSTLALRRTCEALYSRVALDQRLWRDALVSENLVGFLWDLDLVLCQEKGPTETWDWKSLAQRLLVWTAFDTGGEFDDAPLALRNRQRIWRIVVNIGWNDKGDWDAKEYWKGIPDAYLLPGSAHLAQAWHVELIASRSDEEKIIFKLPQ